jgi:hypothetical protein
MKYKALYYLTFFFLLITACEDDDKNEEQAAYTGEWETVVFNNIDPMTSAVVKQKLEFTFTNNDFETIIKQGNHEDSLATAMGVKGDVQKISETEMNIEMTSIGPNIEGSLVYYSKENEVEKESYETFYTSFLSSMMPEEFNANYYINADASPEHMQLIIPAANDTIHLFRVQ